MTTDEMFLACLDRAIKFAEISEFVISIDVMMEHAHRLYDAMPSNEYDRSTRASR